MTVVLCSVVIACTRTGPAPPAPSATPLQSENDQAISSNPTTETASTRSDVGTLGGDSTIEIAAPSYAIMDALSRPEAIWRVLPNVADVQDLGEDQGDLVWRITHAVGMFRGGYVLRVRRDWGDDGTHTIRFWVDTRFDRDVEDAWGYFHLLSLGPDRTLLQYRVRALLMPGITRWLFKQKIQWSLMVVPERTQRFIEEQRIEGQREDAR